MFFKDIKSVNQLQQLYKGFCKKLHPDNKETGSKELFIRMKAEYEELKKRIKKLKVFNVQYDLTDLYYGCEKIVEGYKLTINPKKKITSKLLKGVTKTIAYKVGNENDEVIIKARLDMCGLDYSDGKLIKELVIDKEELSKINPDLENGYLTIRGNSGIINIPFEKILFKVKVR